MATVDPPWMDASAIERTLITPEGIDLRLKLATAGQRAGAFTIDFMLLIVAIGAMTLLAIWALAAMFGEGSAQGLEIVSVIWLLGYFLLRNFYFIAFEIGRRSATLGKRMLGLRVVARDGGRLTADAVIARNLMREIEVYLPLSFVFSGGFGAEGAGGLMIIVGLLWALIFLFFPLFNKDRLRIGDLVAGTWVLYAPRRKLEHDLASSGHERLERYDFTEEQLAVYGEYELKTLERVLRTVNDSTLGSVSNTIREKIGWPYGDDDYDFLNAYYAALSARLERGMLFGKRRMSKFDE